MKKQLAFLLALLMFCTALVTSLVALADKETQEPEATAMPNYFAMINTVDIYGRPFDGSALEGKLSLINIWADWCPPCRSELPALDRLSEKYKDKMVVLGVLPETAKVEDGKLVQAPEKMKAAQEIYENLNVSFPSIVPEEILYSIIAQIGVKAFPTTLFVDGEGRIVYAVEGAMAEEDWVKAIDDVLKSLEQEKQNEAQ